ncbi:hypothetical protein BGZ70_007102 [Mortierella alpina]|uniref:Potassium channel domain-containing protein n=1 Tax=Mortierella alpina TaxID=64518 RepID=A0A9P6J706_MORAP|nr:hypothetical protein BGZ70_007102 [Mortierella alpina]
MSLRNAVIEQFQWRLVERFALPSHLTRVQTRMSAKDLSYPVARFEEEQRVKKVVKRKMIVRMLCIWIVLWFGGAGVFCAFEKWSFLESLYFCYVTLTTIGFGDYVPSEPGSIEFWNIYVFIGLTIFAYILSLFSESMAAHIHLVDDEIVDEDDDMYGWEQCEDPSSYNNSNNGSQFSYRTGLIGVDGLKWIENQQQIHPYQEMQEVSGNGGAVAAANVLLQPEQEPNKSHHHLLHHRPSLSLRFWSQARLQQQQQQQQRPHMARKTSTGRVLMIPARERQQMLQAEYYATHSGPPMGFQLSDNPVNHANNSRNTIQPADGTTIGGTSQGQLTENIGGGASYGDMTRMSAMAPTTIRFVDMYGVPHHRTIHGNRGSQVLAASHNRHSYSGSITSTPYQPYQSSGGYIIGTEGYQEMMAEQRRRRRRRGTLAAAAARVASPLPRPSSSMDRLGGDEASNGGGGETHRLSNDAHPTTLSSGAGSVETPYRPQQQLLHQSSFSQGQPVLQTNALDHQPQVKFESPGASPRSATTTHSSPRHLPEAHLYGRSHFQPHRDSNSPLHQNHLTPFPLGDSQIPYKDYSIYKLPSPGEEEGEKTQKRTSVLASHYDPTNDYHDGHDGHLEDDGHEYHDQGAASETDAYTRFMELAYTRQSNASDATKVASPTEASEPAARYPPHDYSHSLHQQPLQPPQQLQSQQEPPQQPLGSYFADASGPKEEESLPWRRDGVAPDEVVPAADFEHRGRDSVQPPYPVVPHTSLETTPVGPLDAAAVNPLLLQGEGHNTVAPLRRPTSQQQQQLRTWRVGDAADGPSLVATNSSNAQQHQHHRRTSSNESLGPLDEIKSPDAMPSFQDDVDLNHLDPDPVQVREAQRNRTELFRRRDDIERRQFSPPPSLPSPPPSRRHDGT